MDRSHLEWSMTPQSMSSCCYSHYTDVVKENRCNLTDWGGEEGAALNQFIPKQEEAFINPFSSHGSSTRITLYESLIYNSNAM